jgi:hypothetical protein
MEPVTEIVINVALAFGNPILAPSAPSSVKIVFSTLDITLVPIA